MNNLFEKRRTAFLLYFLLRFGNFLLLLYFLFNILPLEGERNHDYIRFIILCSLQDYVDVDSENV